MFRGNHPAKVDEKGRLKFPAEFQQFFNSLGINGFFVTSLDRRIVTIYTVAEWRKTEDFLENCAAEPQYAASVLFNANDLGGRADMDGQGRLLVPAELRGELGIENQQVRLKAAGTRVYVYTDSMYAELRNQAKSMDGQAALTALKKAGLP